ncbi:MAG: hypothetical protein B7Z66_06235 [Chromatiales bacterium 21-64-14]|nr:MAG: hypothetical protein B7Z66_06235 [Chromatiales bacterium 21-64-14]
MLQSLEISAQATRNNFDLIVLDLMLPGMDGLELCRQIARPVRLHPDPDSDRQVERTVTQAGQLHGLSGPIRLARPGGSDRDQAHRGEPRAFAYPPRIIAPGSARARVEVLERGIPCYNPGKLTV